jgi:hypothetical protein
MAAIGIGMEMGSAMSTIWTSDIPWIAAHSTLATLLTLAWVFIPA